MPHPPRVVIPENPKELFQLVGSIYKQDQALGAKSPLHVMEGTPTIAELGPQAANAEALQTEIDKMELQLKNLYGQRQPYLDSMTPFVRNTRTLLLGVYSQNPRKMTEFGFDVKTTEAPPAPPK